MPGFLRILSTESRLVDNEAFVFWILSRTLREYCYKKNVLELHHLDWKTFAGSVSYVRSAWRDKSRRRD